MIITFQLPPPGVPHVWNDPSEPQQRKVELWVRKLPRILSKVVTSTSLLGSFTCRKFTTWDRRLYFPSEGRRAEDFFSPKNPTVSARFEPRELGYQRADHRSRYWVLNIIIKLLCVLAGSSTVDIWWWPIWGWGVLCMVNVEKKGYVIINIKTTTFCALSLCL